MLDGPTDVDLQSDAGIVSFVNSGEMLRMSIACFCVQKEERKFGLVRFNSVCFGSGCVGQVRERERVAIVVDLFQLTVK